MSRGRSWWHTYPNHDGFVDAWGAHVFLKSPQDRCVVRAIVRGFARARSVDEHSHTYLAWRCTLQIFKAQDEKNYCCTLIAEAMRVVAEQTRQQAGRTLRR
mmetsp:Transcript_78624/g.122687  ORF Transcript_78624/g.122687 Transcript_78624/m.122687 type:complete len:101 (-) Transcript_78624:105-407(-)